MTAEERLEKLEWGLNRAKRNNRWLLAGISLFSIVMAVIGLLGLAATTAQATGEKPKEVHATNYVLDDNDGKTRAQFFMSEDGPVLRLNDEKGIGRAILFVHDDGEGLSLFDENNRVRASLSLIQKVPVVFLYDESDNARVKLYYSEKTGPGVSLEDDKGNRLPIK
jgi:hypothetical protein